MCDFETVILDEVNIEAQLLIYESQDEGLVVSI